MQSGELKEKVSTAITIIKKIKRRLNLYFFDKMKANGKDFRLTPKDIKNSEELAKKLKGDSDKETLTNILEWQDRNIEFWWERYPLAPILMVFIAFSLLAYIIKPFALLYVGCLGAIALILVYLLFRYSSFIGEKPIKEKTSKFLKLVCNTFRLSNLPVDNILKDKLAVCRDYATLTASLLLNMYPDSEVRLITKVSYGTAGIEIKNKIYVLDQHLPIKSLDNWQKILSTHAAIYKLKNNKESKRKPIDVVFDGIEEMPKKSNEPSPKINTEKLEKLTEEIAQILGIRQISYIDKPDFEIELLNYAKYYDDDEIIKYSFMRTIKNRLEREFCGKLDKISGVNISQKNERDLIVSLCL